MLPRNKEEMLKASFPLLSFPYQRNVRDYFTTELLVTNYEQ
jgi:hypothetical protein